MDATLVKPREGADSVSEIGGRKWRHHEIRTNEFVCEEESTGASQALNSIE